MELGLAIVVLMGLRGSGKSTLGRALAQRLSREFVDLDDHTPRVLGHATVAAAWAAAGEPAFREAETAALRTVLARSGLVLALGGGTPTAPGAEVLLRAEQRIGRVKIVYLRCPPVELRRRLSETGVGANRPSLTGVGALDEIEAVFAQRDPMYRALADEVVEGIGSVEAGLERLTRMFGGA